MNLHDRVKRALEQDNTLVTDWDKLSKAKGFTEDYLNFLGLTKSDLKTLERHGMAVRGHTQNVFMAGDSLPNGKTVP